MNRHDHNQNGMANHGPEKPALAGLARELQLIVACTMGQIVQAAHEHPAAAMALDELMAVIPRGFFTRPGGGVVVVVIPGAFIDGARWALEEARGRYNGLRVLLAHYG